MPKVVLHGHRATDDAIYENAYVSTEEMTKDSDYVIVRSDDTKEPIAYVPRNLLKRVDVTDM